MVKDVSRNQCERRRRVRAAFFAAAERPLPVFVREALRPAAERAAALRREAARRAWRESSLRETVLRGSRSSARLTARATRGRRRGRRLCWPAS